MTASGQVRTPVFGEAYASSMNVAFPLALAASAAAGIWALAQSVDDTNSSVKTAKALAIVDWIGPKRDDFDDKCATFDRSAASCKEALEELAKGIARAWVAARGQQDRINHARYVEHQKSQESGPRSWGITEAFIGEKDYGPPPGDPDVPSDPFFEPTRDPVQGAYEHSMTG